MLYMFKTFVSLLSGHTSYIRLYQVYQAYCTSAAWKNEVQKKKPTFLMLPDIPQGLLSICHSGKHGEVALPQSMKCCIVSKGNCFFEAKH